MYTVVHNQNEPGLAILDKAYAFLTHFNYWTAPSRLQKLTYNRDSDKNGFQVISSYFAESVHCFELVLPLDPPVSTHEKCISRTIPQLFRLYLSGRSFRLSYRIPILATGCLRAQFLGCFSSPSLWYHLDLSFRNMTFQDTAMLMMSAQLYLLFQPDLTTAAWISAHRTDLNSASIQLSFFCIALLQCRLWIELNFDKTELFVVSAITRLL